MNEHSRFPKPRWLFGEPPPQAEPQPTWTLGDPEHPPWLTYGDVRNMTDDDNLIVHLRTRISELERERDFWKQMYDDLRADDGGPFE